MNRLPLLTDTQYQTLINALHSAAIAYKETADRPIVMLQSPRLSETLSMQAEDLQTLINWLEADTVDV